MKTTLHKANTRGYADHGWLKANHTFSFARYYDPSRINFGALRVLNDDKIAPQMGFGTHPHDNMEIVSIILEGSISHKDSMGNKLEIKKDEVQIMSAGSGITHSEFNADKKEVLNILQIWVFPKEHDIEPRYDQITLDPAARKNNIQFIVTPDKNQPMWINQDAWFSRAAITQGKELDYKINKEGNGVYAFVIDGDIIIEGQLLNKRDGFGIWETAAFKIKAETNAEILLIEVPMDI